MKIEEKILNPVCIVLGDNSNIIIPNEKESYPLIPGVLLGGDHYGFVIIINYGGKQKEIYYSTQCKIAAAGIENNVLKIFEEGKKKPWIFDKKGQLKYSAFNDFSKEFIQKYDIVKENYDLFMGQPVLNNPIKIKISKNPEESVIAKDDNVDKDYPLYPGAIIGTTHYGFILTIETDNGEIERVYPTQNKIDAIACEKNYYDDLKIYEKGKYFPWVFNHDGKFVKKASINKFARMDKSFIEESYNNGFEENIDCFQLKKK